MNITTSDMSRHQTISKPRLGFHWLKVVAGSPAVWPKCDRFGVFFVGNVCTFFTTKLGKRIRNILQTKTPFKTPCISEMILTFTSFVMEVWCFFFPGIESRSYDRVCHGCVQILVRSFQTLLGFSQQAWRIRSVIISPEHSRRPQVIFDSGHWICIDTRLVG